MAESTNSGEGPEGARQTPLTRAMATIRSLRRRLEEQEGGQPVAVVGIGLRLPGGIDGLDGYWEALAAGRDLVRELPRNRMGPFAAEWRNLPRHGGFLDEVLDFDAAFFGISPREARHLDPQHRLLLETAWEAMEDAALPAERLAGSRTGLYLGIMWQDYREWLAGEPDAYWTTGNGHNFAAGRIAYALGLTGPALSVDTACSSSLVSVHLAVQALRRDECDLAFAAGTNLIMSPRSMRLVQETRSLAPDGRCKTFDARADGFVRGEGCGVLVLKRLDHALRDGDRVHAVIRGTAVNQDGRSGGFTAPNVLSQVALLERALAEAGLEPSDIGYVEAHGTGTSLGDPIEMEALATALGRRNGGAPLTVGAVKTNFGHLESAAGVAGLVKAVLCLRHRRIPPLVNFRTLNPRIDLSGTAVTLPTELSEWPREAGRYAGVSSFGMSGTNAHVILGAPEPAAAAPTGEPVEGFELSARTDRALRELAGRYAERLAGLDPAAYPAFAETATLGRTRHPVRARITAADPAAAVRALRALAAGAAPGPDAGLPEPAPGPEGLPEGTAPAGPRRITDLPHYPWQRERYAPERADAAPADGGAVDGGAADRDGAAAGTPGTEGLVHRLSWRQRPAAPPAAPAAPVLAGDDTATLTLLAREAAALGVRGTVLSPSSAPLPEGWEHGPLPADADAWAGFWRSRPAGTGDLVLVLSPYALPGAEAAPGRPEPGGTAASCADAAAEAGPDGLRDADPVADGTALCLAVTRAVSALAASGRAGRAWVVTRAVLRTGDDERTLAGTHGLLPGLAPVLGLEAGSAWGGIVDLPAAPAPQDARALLGFLAERGGADTGPVEDLAAVRAGAVRVARLTPSAAGAPITVRGDGTYLVTGGLGAVGRELVAEVVDRGARHLLLVGRRPESGLAPEAAEFLRGLAGRGVRAVYRGGGCATREAVAAACAALDGMPPVRGVLHAAGALRRTPLPDLGPEDFTDALGGKAAGAWWLHRASPAWQLDFFVLVSSVSAVWGTDGCAAYAAANGALDALAAHRAGLGLPAVSIAYGPWRLDGAGMADDALRERSARMGVGALDAADGRAALAALGGGPESCPVACRLDRARLRAVLDGLRPRGLLAPTGEAAGGATAAAGQEAAREPSVAAELAALPRRARPEAARAHVARLTAAQLGFDDPSRVGRDTGFFDLGMDSITAVDLAARLTEAFEVPLQVADVFDHPTVRELAAYLLARPSGAAAGARDDGAPAAAAEQPPAAAPAAQHAADSAPAPAAAAARRRADHGDREPIAIVGMAGRFPSADSVEELWQLLSEGRDGVTRIPADRFDARLLAGGRITTDQGGFVRDPDRFDAAFFGIPAREAEHLDPQQRLLLESAWHALEDGGIDPHSLRGSRTGVFVGISYADYARLLAQGGPDGVDAYYSTGTALNAAAGRLSYTLGLNGPAAAVDTACSSSLVALHLAVRSLRSGESDLVLAGGVNLLLDPMSWVAVSRAHMLSPAGRCRTFSADADGFVRSEGCGVLVLKRLGDARADGDRVLAVIRGSAVNQDGASSGLTAPSGSAQEALIAAALADAGTDPAEVSYLEAHGTGTSLGDPIEVGAAWRVLGRGRDRERPLLLGSVKSSIGHCESAAGVAAVVKTVLALRHGLLPADLHFDRPNPHIAWQDMDLRVVDAATPWPSGARPRVAGVSGFGFTGTNAHLVIADPPDEPPALPAPPPGPYLLPLSAPDPEGLDRLGAAWERRLSEADDVDLPALARTAGAGRAHFRHRRALLGTTREELLDQLRAAAPPGPAGREPAVAFLFSGQGSQYFGMGRELYETEPVFRRVFDLGDEALAPSLGASLVDLVLRGGDREAVNETRVTQPALVVLESALAALWESWGVRAAAVMGHSVGEIAAAVHAGVLDLPSGLRLIGERGRLMQSTERGAMLAVAAPEEQVRAWIDGTGLDVAAVNGPEAVVVSGRPDAVDALAARLREQGCRARRLSVSHAFHSRLLDPVLDDLAAVLRPLEFRPPEIPLVSNLTGDLAGPDTYDAGYWCRHARNPVRFHDGARTLAGLGVDVCLEIGPDRTLVNLVRAAGLAPAGGLLSSLRRGGGDRAALLAALRGLYLAGQPVDWQAVGRGAGAARPGAGRAPRYPFARTRHWAPAAAAPAALPSAGGPAWGSPLRSPAVTGRVWATERSRDYPAHLIDHQLFGTVSVPGASQTATALSALASGGGPVALEDVHFPRALVLREGERYELQTVEAETGRGGRALSVQSLLDPETGRWQEHLVARVAADPRPPGPAAPDPQAFAAAAERRLTGEDFYRHLRGLGYHLGPSFRWIAEAWIRGDEALVRYRQPVPLSEDPAGWAIHPGLLDSCLQSAVVFAVAGGGEPDEEEALAIPFAIRRIALPRRPEPEAPLWGHIRARCNDRPADGLLQVESADLHLFDGGGATVLAVEGFRFRRAPRALLESSLRAGSGRAYRLAWREQPLPADRTPEPHRIALLGADADQAAGTAAQALRTACEKLGHQVFDASADTLDAGGADLVLDLRFLGASSADPADALAACTALAGTLRAVPRGLPYAVAGAAGDAAAPVREALWGLLASLEAEQPDRRLPRIELAGDWDAAAASAALGALLDDGFPESRLRVTGTTVQAARLTPAEPADPAAAARLAGGAVLITGGTGGLGLSTAGMLARQGARSVTLMARSEPDATTRGVLAELAGLGVAARVVRGDVTRPEDCRRAVAEAGREAPLRAVLHLAGTAADGAFEQLSPQDFRSVFAAKAQGAANLAAALDGTALDLLLLYSSASAVLGSAGQTNYAAANGWLEGFARHLRARGLPARSVAWGPWHPERRGGLAASAATGRAGARLGLRHLTDPEAEELLPQAAAGADGPLVAVAVDARRWTEQLAGHPRGALLAELVPAAERTRPAPAAPAAEPRGALRAELAALPGEERDDRLRQAVRDLVGEVLGAPAEVDGEIGFSEAGLDSIMVIDLRSRLSHRLDLELPATVALDHPTVDRLTAHLADLLGPSDGVRPPDPAADAPDPDAPAPDGPAPDGPGPAGAGPAARPPGGPDGDDLADLSFEELLQAVEQAVANDLSEK